MITASLWTRFACAGLLLALAGSARAELEITIEEFVSDAVPIAVVPFGWTGDGAAPFDLADIVAADLRSSGRFAPIARSDMLGSPSTRAEIDFEDWRLLNTDVVVIGRLQPTSPGRFEIRFQVFNVFQGEQLIGYRMPVKHDNHRATAHRISDMIYEQLTGEPGAFSTRIAYVSVENNSEVALHRLMVADVDGANAQVIAESPDPLMSPAWSPDGRMLAYVSFEGGDSAVFVQVLVSGRRQKVSGRRGVNGAPAWSPDGTHLALTLSAEEGNLDIYMLNPRDGTILRLTHNAAIDTEPVWSADGDTIFFTSDRSGGPQVYRVEVASGRPRRVTFEGNYNARPRLSPDGKTVAVVHNDRGNYRIALVDLETHTTRVLTDGRLDESPSFAPNGSSIIYATKDRGVGVLAAVSADGRFRQRLASQAGDVREPVWSPFLSQR